MENVNKDTKAVKKTNTRLIVMCALFSALIAAGAFIRIPLPYISFSMQTMFVSLAGMLLGARAGAVSVIVYVAVGLVGVPIFTMGGGFAYVLQPSFGFLLGFILQAAITGRFTSKIGKPGVKNLFLAQLPGVFAMYAVGLPYFFLISTVYLNNGLGVGALFIYCFAATLPGDILKSLLAAWLGKRLLPVLGTNLLTAGKNFYA